MCSPWAMHGDPDTRPARELSVHLDDAIDQVHDWQVVRGSRRTRRHQARLSPTIAAQRRVGDFDDQVRAFGMSGAVVGEGEHAEVGLGFG